VRGDSADLGTEVIYPPRVRPVIASVAAGATFGVLLGGVVYVTVLRGEPHGWVVALPIVAGLALLGAIADGVGRGASDPRQLAHPLPLLQLDAYGLECALGGLWWTDVARIGVAQDAYPVEGGNGVREWISISLRAGAEFHRTPRDYYRGSMERARLDADGRLELPLWTSKERVLDALGRFYAGPIS